jgi:hypothetical protein
MNKVLEDAWAVKDKAHRGWIGWYSDEPIGVRCVRKAGNPVLFKTPEDAVAAATRARREDKAKMPAIRVTRQMVMSGRSNKRLFQKALSR